MDLKFYLNKFVKVDNIENYSLNNLLQLKTCYEEFLDNSEGLDPDFPTLNFSGKGKKINKGKNIYTLFEEDDISENFKGINEGRLNILNKI